MRGLPGDATITQDCATPKRQSEGTNLHGVEKKALSLFRSAGLDETIRHLLTLPKMKTCQRSRDSSRFRYDGAQNHAARFSPEWKSALFKTAPYKGFGIPTRAI